jgi:hypothetical protein
MIFQVLTVMSMKMAVFWDVAPCNLVDIGQYVPDYTVQHPRRQPSSVNNLFSSKLCVCKSYISVNGNDNFFCV